MATRSSSTPRRRKRPAVERRADPATAGSLHQLKGLLARPIGLEQRAGRWHVVLVERRVTPEVAAPPTLTQQRTELRARLMAHRIDHAELVMRHLVFVHDELGKRGWPGVEALPAALLGKALVQAKLLVSDDPSPAMVSLIDRLRLVRAGAELREERAATRERESQWQAAAAQPIPEPQDKAPARRHEAAPGPDTVVSEATHEEFEEVERSWVEAPPPGAVEPDPRR